MRMKTIVFFGDKAAISCLQPKYELLHQLINATILQMSQLGQSQILQQNDVKKIFLPIGKVRLSHMPTDLEESEFEMCCFEMS